MVSRQVAQQLCRLLTNPLPGQARSLLGSRLERLPAALTALAEVSRGSRRRLPSPLFISAASSCFVENPPLSPGVGTVLVSKEMRGQWSYD